MQLFNMPRKCNSSAAEFHDNSNIGKISKQSLLIFIIILLMLVGSLTCETDDENFKNCYYYFAF